MARLDDPQHVYRATFEYDERSRTWTGTVVEIEACSVRAGTLDETKSYLREALAAVLDVSSAADLALHESVIDPRKDARTPDLA